MFKYARSHRTESGKVKIDKENRVLLDTIGVVVRYFLKLHIQRVLLAFETGAPSFRHSQIIMTELGRWGRTTVSPPLFKQL